MPPRPYLYLCRGHTCGYTQQSNTAAVVIYLFMPWPCPGRIRIRVAAVFLFVPWHYLDWKHTHNNQRIGEMAHTQQLNNAAAAVFVFVPRRGRTQNNQTMLPRPYCYSCHGHAHNSQIMLPPVHTTIKWCRRLILSRASANAWPYLEN